MVSPWPDGDEREVEAALRPRRLEDFVGQPRVREQLGLVLTSALLHAPFYLYVFFGTVRYLFHDDQVTTDELYAIGAAFTVLAWAFAFIYVAVEIIWPGSIKPLGNGTERFFDLLFFSFTNLTSVGLSDILPVGDHARSVVMVEQVAGVLYVALVVARLVGLTVARQSNRPGGIG